MYASNLLELLPSELISFILKYLPAQDLENCHSINDIWKSEANLELTKRITLMDFQFGRSVQGNYTVKKFYSKLKECNMRIGYPEEHLKWLFLRGLSPENTIKVLMDGLQVLALDEIVESLVLLLWSPL
jgi:hypothetical protein